ncbi:MAG TPA: phytanoyl-CoA dioxygenase family protein [Propionibacteriaceae bacterium]|nr:phytanoyl-CoA dioxygenase family protein [Propionibacteriaceae bacterium]
MTTTITEQRVPPVLQSSGVALDTGADSFGPMRSSADLVDDPAALRDRMGEDGYLYLPGYLDRDQVLAARRATVDKLAALGHLAPNTDPMNAIAQPGTKVKFAPELAEDNAPLHDLLYGGRMMDLYRRFFGEEALHFTYTWVRAVSPGKGTAPHGDSVFMNRGTRELYTAWTPLGDISYDLGGLIVLERSHRLDEMVRTYHQQDVDRFCENGPDAALYASGEKWWNGSLSDDPAELRRQLGLRWLTTEFRAGDLVTFSIYTLHGSLDNQTDRIRLSSDSRYQPASQPADERWVGEQPIGHGPAAKRGQIC